MTSRDRVINTVFHKASAQIPTLLTIPPEVYQFRREECDELRVRFASDLEFLDYRFSGEKAAAASDSFFTDAWGCFWKKTPGGFSPEESFSLLDGIHDLKSLSPPKTPVFSSEIENIAESCENNSRFLILQSGIHPFRRLLALLGREETLSAIRQKSPELRTFLKRLHEYYINQLRQWCTAPVDAVCIGDDWADESGLFFPADIWEDLFLPMIAEYGEILKSHDKFVYFTSAGNIQQLMPSLITAGVDVVRYNDSAVNTSRLAAAYSGAITLHIIMDDARTERISDKEISEKILAIRRAAGESGGVIAECRMSADVPLRNISGTILNWKRRMPVEF